MMWEYTQSKAKKMKKILIISMLLVFGFSFSQETKLETPKESIKTEVVFGKKKTKQYYLNIIYTKSNFERLFSLSKKEKIKYC